MKATFTERRGWGQKSNLPHPKR